MKIKFLPLLYGLVLSLFFITCIREINYINDDIDRSALVVSGGFYNSSGPFKLKLSRPTNYEKRDFEPVKGATVVLSDDEGKQGVYVETDPLKYPGEYILSGFEGAPGRIYTLDILLADGAAYRSRPQQMPEPLPMDSTEMKFVFLEDVTAEGDIVKVPFALIYAHSSTSDQSTEYCLRWEGENTFIFNELYIPGAPQKQCFVTNGISAQTVNIVDPAALQPGTSLFEYVGRRRVDYSFDLRNCFSVYQHTIGKDAYKYWSRVQSVIRPTGTIFDTPPAPIPGNLENLSDPARPALGFFEVGASDTTRIYVNRGDLPFEVVAFIPLHCGSGNPAASKHPECLDCLKLSSSTLQKPDWWQ